MRVVFDVLGSTEHSGGMRLHSTQLINAWLRLWPEDDVTIVGPDWTSAEFGSRASIRIWDNESALRRAWGQLFESRRTAIEFHAEALVSLSPIVSPFYRGTSVCFQHDWRHKRNPREFPLVQRFYRQLWEVSARHATINACISRKALEETSALIPSARSVLVENGWDHAREWSIPMDRTNGSHVVAFGHHNNKRPELAIEALAFLRNEQGSDVSLVVLGARGQYAEELCAVAREFGVDDAVEIPGFVSEEVYQTTMATAAAVVMPSTDEGFGLPIAEALYLGIPAVVTDDSGMPEIFGDSISSAAPNARSLAVTLSEALSRPSGAGRPVQAGMTTWEAAATKLRAAIQTISSS